MNPLMLLSEHGQSYWLDNLTRDMLESGELARRAATEGLRGVTANPATFEKAISSSPAYDAQIGAEARSGSDSARILESLVVRDVRAACDVLRPVFDATEGLDGYVSLEVSPHLAHDTDGSCEEARRLWAAVDRPNLMIKVPGTREGIAAIESLLFEGVNVNVTLLFAVERYEQVAEAHTRALERRAEAGQPVDVVASVASFFLSRIDVLVDQLLRHRIGQVREERQPDPARLLGKAAVANAKRAYRAYRKRLAGERWQRLAALGARPQRLLWASTSTKNPDYDALMYVEPLIGAGTVNTMPEKTVAVFAERGTVRDTVAREIRDSDATMRCLRTLGIDMRQVTQQLENEGIEKFVRPYDDLLDLIERKRRAHAGSGDTGPLERAALRLRRDVLRMTTAAGSGHPSSCLSCAEIVAALYFRVLRWDPSDPGARDVDSFVLSKGHAAPILWAALAEAGAIDEDLAGLRTFRSTLEGHPTPRNPWVRVATGSLGQGLPAATGIALANRLDGIPARVYCLLGDGECSEGSIWEAAQFASLHRLGGVVAIVDVNGLGQSGPAPYRHDTGILAGRFRAFGWKVVEIDGHDLEQVLGALGQAGTDGGEPLAIVARTEKGKGVSLLAGKPGWHGKALDEAQMREALEELGEPGPLPEVRPQRLGGRAAPPPHAVPPMRVEYAAGTEVATRDAFGAALRKLGDALPAVVALDADVRDSTRSSAFADAHAERFFEAWIAEQGMVGAAIGLAACGKIPFVATFACFLTRAADFVRMAGHSSLPHLVFCGSHAGVSIGEDGPSQMGLEDLALFRALHGSTVLYPCDAVSAERLTAEAAAVEGIVYLRTTRPKTPVLYSEDDDFPVGGSKTLRASDHDRVTLVAAGITVHEALAAHETLAARGINARVIDAYSVKPVDAGSLRRAAEETGHLIVVEDHRVEGGLGDAVAEAVDGRAALTRLAVTAEPRSARPEELLALCGISREAIARAATAVVGGQHA